MLGSCRSLLSSASAIGEQAQTLQRGDTGVLRIAASPVQMELVFTTFLQPFARRYPNVQVKLIEAAGTKTLALIERGEIHLGISLLQSIQADDRLFGIYPVPPVELLAACHPGFPLERGAAVDIGSVSMHPLLLLDPGFVVRKTFDTACRLARLRPTVLLKRRAPNLLAFAEAGLGSRSFRQSCGHIATDCVSRTSCTNADRSGNRSRSCGTSVARFRSMRRISAQTLQPICAKSPPSCNGQFKSWAVGTGVMVPWAPRSGKGSFTSVSQHPTDVRFTLNCGHRRASQRTT